MTESSNYPEPTASPPGVDATTGSEDLAQANDEFANLLRNTQIATIFLDQEYRIRNFTPLATEIYPLVTEDIGRSLAKIEPLVGVIAPLPDLSDLDRDQPIEDLIEADGEKWFLRRVVPYQSRSGELDGMVVTFVDVTSRTIAQKKLEASELQLRSLMSSTAEGIYGIDLSGNCTFANNACAKLLGYQTTEELIGRQMHDLLHHTRADGNPYPNEECRIYLSFRAGCEVHVDDEVFWRADGTSFDAEYWSYPILRDGEVAGCVVTFMDITARRKTEGEIAKRQAGLELALSAGRLASWQWEIAEDRLTLSTQFYDLFGYKTGQLGLNQAGFMAIIHADDRPYVQGRLDDVSNGLCTEYEMEFRVLRGDNQQVMWTYGRGAIERDESGKALRITAVASDITQRKRWENELANREAHLRRVIDNVLFFIGVLDTDGTLLEANATAMNAGGVTRDEVIGKKFWDCYWWNFDEQIMQQLQETIRRAAAGEIVRHDVDVRMAGDTRIKIDFMLSPVRDDDGKITHLIPSGVDISERILAKEAAVKRERHLSLAQEAGKLGSWVWDITAGRITWSDRLHEMYGYAKGEFKETPEGFLEIVIPEDRAIVQDVIDSILHSDSENEEFECRSVRGTDGQIIWSQVRGVIERDREGNAIRIAGFAVDITERKRRELSLSFFAELQLEVASLNSAQEIVHVAGERVASFLQLSRCLFVAMDEEAVTAEVFHDHHAAGLESLCGVYKMSNFVCDEERALLRSGNTLVINDTSAPTRDVESRAQFAALGIGALVDAPCLQDQSLKFLLAATKEHPYRWRCDETDLLQELATRIYLWIERARAEDALLESERTLRESEELLQLAIDVADFSIGRIDYVENTIELPAEAARLYGFGDDPITVTREEMHAVFHPDDRRKLNLLIQNCIGHASDGRISMEHRVMWPNGEVRWLNIRKQLFFDHSVTPPRPLYAILVAQDITQRHHFEESLKEARALAEAANEAKSAFLANMSHEIRTPMTAILGYADLIAETIADEKTLGHVHTIRSNGDYLLDIINDILDLSKIEAGKFEIGRERFSPQKLIEEVRSTMDVRAKERKLGLYIEYRGDIPVEIESDPKLLRQILINLIGNAIKFTPTGEVRTVVSYIRDDSPMLQFDVIDTGIGMNDEQQKRLFQPFSQGDGNVNREFGGTGLGLAISKRLSELLGGEITVQSALGKGSTFTATVATGSVGDVQLVRPRRSRGDLKTPPKKDVLLDCHILVVDDRRDIRFLSKSLLAKAGATVFEAEDGEVAVELVNESLSKGRPYDLILLDMQMPRLDGYQTAEKLRRLGFSGPIIALTADAMQGDMVRCIESGCNDYLSKPIDKAILLEKIDRYISGNVSG